MEGKKTKMGRDRRGKRRKRSVCAEVEKELERERKGFCVREREKEEDREGDSTQ